MEMREVWVGGCEKTNQRSPSQRREQAGESHGRPRKTRASWAGNVGVQATGSGGGGSGSVAGMGIPTALAVSYRGNATGRERQSGCKPGLGLLHGNPRWQTNLGG